MARTETIQKQQSEDVQRTEQIAGGLVGETPKEPQVENTTGISFLDRMIDRAAYETSAAVYTCLELVKDNEELGEGIQAFIKKLIPNFFEQIWPETTGAEDGENLDIECDVMPSMQWLRFLDGFKAAMPSETNYDKGSQRAESGAAKVSQEIAGDPVLRTIKRWLAHRSYSEKLTAILSWELINKNSEFEKPDNYIGNDFSKQWREEIIKTSGDPEYLKNADADEIAITAQTAMMLYWEV